MSINRCVRRSRMFYNLVRLFSVFGFAGKITFYLGGPLEPLCIFAAYLNSFGTQVNYVLISKILVYAVKK